MGANRMGPSYRQYGHWLGNFKSEAAVGLSQGRGGAGPKEAYVLVGQAQDKGGAA